MAIVPNTRLNGKLFFKSLDLERPIIEADAQMDGAKNIKFKLIHGVEGRLSLFNEINFRVNEEFYHANDLYSCQVTSALIQKLKVNDFCLTMVSGTFQIFEEGIGTIESFALQGAFARGRVNITSDLRLF